MAQVVPGAGATGMAAVIHSTAGGPALVDIARPNAAGVSHNQYDRFDVAPAGLILNNSAAPSVTMIGGAISGNAHLNAGSARVIVNEVISSAPSSLRGAIEVAGSRADVVVANPNGLHCDGCSFINASRGTLTTGVPLLGANGQLHGFSVETGHLHVGTRGLDARGLEQLDLLARGISVDGDVQAERIRVIAGANRVEYEQEGAIQALSGEGPTPPFAIDVSKLGSMYAGHIFMVSNESGAGVNSSGRLVASSGSVTLSSAGELTVHDIRGASGVQLEASGGNLLITGKVDSSAALALASTGEVRNRGELSSAHAMTIDAPMVIQGEESKMHSQGDLRIAGDLHNRGGHVEVGKDLEVLGELVNENADLQVGRRESIAPANEVRYLDERAPESSYRAEDVRFDAEGNLIVPGDSYPFEQYGHERYRSVWKGDLPEGHRLRKPRYADDDPIWARFDVPPPDLSGLSAPQIPRLAGDCTSMGARSSSAQCVGYWAAHDVYRELVDARRAKSLEQLQLKLNQFNENLTERTASSYFVKTVNEVHTVEEFVASSRPGEITVRGRMHIHGGSNIDSAINAEGGFVSDGGFVNQATPVRRTVTARGDVRRSSKEDPSVWNLWQGERRSEQARPTVAVLSIGDSLSVEGLAPEAALPEPAPEVTAARQPRDEFGHGQCASGGQDVDLGNPTQPTNAHVVPRGSIVANDIEVQAGDQSFVNSGVLHAHGQASTAQAAGGEIRVNAHRITHEGALTAQTTSLLASADLIVAGGNFASGDHHGASQLNLRAGGNVELLPLRHVVSLVEQGEDARLRHELSGRSSHLNATQIGIHAGGNVLTQGAKVHAGEALSVAANGRVDLQAFQEHRKFESGVGPRGVDGKTGAEHWSQHDVSLQVSELSAGEVRLSAGKDVWIAGSRINSLGHIDVSAQNIDLVASIAEQSIDVKSSGGTHDLHTESTYQTLGETTLAAAKGVKMVASANISMSGGGIDVKDGAVHIDAGGDVSVENARTRVFKKGAYSESSWMPGNWREFSLESEEERISSAQVRGREVTVSANRDVLVQGAKIAGTHRVTLRGDRNVHLADTTSSQTERVQDESKSFGAFMSGYLPSFGSKGSSKKTDMKWAETDRVNVGADKGDVAIQAGNRYSQTGGQLEAANDVHVRAQDISLSMQQVDGRKITEEGGGQTALTLGVGFMGFASLAGAGVQNLRDISASPNWHAGTSRAVAGVRSTLAAGRMLMPGVDDKGHVVAPAVMEFGKLTGGIRLDAGTNSRSSRSDEEKAKANPAIVKGGGTVAFVADALGGSITSSGAELEGGRLSLQAATIELNGAKRSERREASEASTYGGVGTFIGLGSGGDIMAGAYNAHEGTETQNLVPTHLKAVRQIRMDAGKGIALIGSKLAAGSVVIRANDDLTIRSEQDTQSGQAQRASTDFFAGMGDGMSWGGISTDRPEVDARFENVALQSGIQAGAQGFDISVGGQVNLIGAALASEAPAELNRLAADGVKSLDVSNISQHKTDALSGYLGFSSFESGNLGRGFSLLPTILPESSGTSGSHTTSTLAPAVTVLNQKALPSVHGSDAGGTRANGSELALPNPGKILDDRATTTMALFFANHRRMRGEWEAFAKSREASAAKQQDASAAARWGEAGMWRALGETSIDAFAGRLGVP